MWRRFSEEERQTIWDMREAGVPAKRIARHLGRQNSSLRKFIADAGGKRPQVRERSGLRLSLAEREEISRGLAAGRSIRAISTGLGRAPSTICREVNTKWRTPALPRTRGGPGGRSSWIAPEGDQIRALPLLGFERSRTRGQRKRRNSARDPVQDAAQRDDAL